MSDSTTADTPSTPPSAAASATPSAPPTAARFVTGSLFRHVMVMAGTGAIGLVAVFAVDLINLLYISKLKSSTITAAVGFAGLVGFIHTSICIGLMIGITACVSRLIGAGRSSDAKRMASHSLVIMACITAVLMVLTLLFLQPLLTLLGANPEVAQLAARYLHISLPVLPLFGIGIACSALLRSVGDARRSMMVTLGAAATTAVLDPLFIFYFGMGLEGAAVVALIARSALFAIGMHGVWRVHRMLAPVERSRIQEDGLTLLKVAGPAVLTNVATPVAALLVTKSIARFGSEAVAGQVTIDRITPVAFGLIYSLSGAVGPIFSQNLGAKQFARVRETLRSSMWFMAIAVGCAWLLLALLQGFLIHAFHLGGLSSQMVHAFCSWLAAGFFFAGALFVANAAFNNLGKPLWSTGFNWARATVGTIPFIWWGAQYGPIQVLAAQTVGTAIFGALAMWTAYYLTTHLDRPR